MKQDVSHTITFDIVLKVEKVDPFGDATVNVKYSSIKLKQTSPLGPIEYDSSNPSGEMNPVTKVFDSMVGQEMTVILTPKGTIKSIKGLDELSSKIIDSAGTPEGPDRDIIQQTIKENFGDEAMQGMLGNVTGNLPGKPVSIGETWTNKTVISEKMPMIIVQTNTLKEVKDGKAIITTTGMIKPNPDGETLVMGPMSMSMDLTGDMHGTLELDIETGLTVGGNLKQEITGKLTMGGIPGAQALEEGQDKDTPAAESISFPMTIKSVTKFGTF